MARRAPASGEGHDRVAEHLRSEADRIHPPEDFVARLEEDLLERRRRRWTSGTSRERSSSRYPDLNKGLLGLLGAAAVLVVMSTVALLASSEDRVEPMRPVAVPTPTGSQEPDPGSVPGPASAALGYVPGVGFVDMETTRMLDEPTEVERDGVVLRVERVVARPDRTTVELSTENALPPVPVETIVQQRISLELEPILRLPSGEALTEREVEGDLSRTTIHFEPLPRDVDRFVLELARLPMMLPGEAPEGWSIPLRVRSLTDHASGSAVSKRLVQPHSPDGAVDTHEDVAFRVLAVARTPEETAVRVQIQWLGPEQQSFRYGILRWVEFSDDRGHVYKNLAHVHESDGHEGGGFQYGSSRGPQETSEAPPTATPSVQSYEETLRFEPLDPAARELTLRTNDIGFDVAVDERFTVDLGDGLPPNDRLPLDVQLQVHGAPLRFTGVRLVEGAEGSSRGTASSKRLVLDADPIEGTRIVHKLHLDGDPDVFRPSLSDSPRSDPSQDASQHHLTLREEAAVPTGPVEVRVRGAQGVVRGPWEVRWEVE